IGNDIAQITGASEATAMQRLGAALSRVRGLTADSLTLVEKQLFLRQLRSLDAGALAGLLQCFTGETLVLTRSGMIRFDELKPGDQVGCCDEMNPFGALEWKTVEEIFRARAEIWHLHVDGAVIRTTAGHKIYVWGKGWIPTRDLQPGDKLRTD